MWCAWPAMEHGGGRAAAKARGKEETPRGRELDSSLTWTPRVTREKERGVE